MTKQQLDALSRKIISEIKVKQSEIIDETRTEIFEKNKSELDEFLSQIPIFPNSIVSVKLVYNFLGYNFGDYRYVDVSEIERKVKNDFNQACENQAKKYIPKLPDEQSIKDQIILAEMQNDDIDKIIETITNQYV